MPARTTALRALIACRTSGAWSDAVLKDYMEGAELSPKDAGLCTTLCCGVLQNRALLDYYIDSFLTGWKRLQPVLRDILRLAVYQIMFLDRIPDSAAVNEGVKMAKKQFSQREAGLVNGVLRNLLRNKEQLTPPRDYHIRYSHPSELVDLMKQSVGKQLEAVLQADNSSPETTAQRNTLKCTEEQLLACWDEEGVVYQPHSWLKDCWTLRNTGNIAKLSSFQKGLFQIQDPAARLSVDVLRPQAGWSVLDLCSAPGGKSMAAAMHMGNQGEIISCDVHGGKLPQITAAAERLGVSIVTTMENDAARFRPQFQGRFDAVIADVPCSGLGVIRKKPDIRYKSIQDMEALPELQLSILRQGAEYVKQGGYLLYSTCTILKRENEAVVKAFLEENPRFLLEELSLPQGLSAQEVGMMTLYQGIHDCDGFFLCLMRKCR